MLQKVLILESIPVQKIVSELLVLKMWYFPILRFGRPANGRVEG